MKTQSDYIFFGILGLCIVASIYYSVFSTSIFSVFNWLAVIFWIVALFLRIVKPRLGRYMLGITLLLATLNVINFLTIKIKVEGLIDPFLLLITLIFYLINKKRINNIMSALIHGTKEEQTNKYNIQRNVYLKRFSAMTEKELAETMRHYNEHPPAAQAALQQLRTSTYTSKNQTENKLT